MKLSTFKDMKAAAPPRIWESPPVNPMEHCGRCGFTRKSHDNATHAFVKPVDTDAEAERQRDKDDLTIISLRQGWCPICSYPAEHTAHATESHIHWYHCTRNQLHFWEVDSKANLLTAMT